MRFDKSFPVFRTIASGLLLATMGLLLIHRDGDSGLFPPLDDEGVTVWVIDNGLHSDLVLPVDRLRARGGQTAEALKRMPATRFVAVGWGDAKFFADASPARDPRRPARPVRAGKSLGRAHRPAEPAAGRGLQRDRAGASPVRSGLRAPGATPRPQLHRDARALGALPKAASDSRYFKSREHFSLLHDYNDWTAELVSAAGAPTRPAVDALSAGLVWDLMTEDHARRLR